MKCPNCGCEAPHGTLDCPKCQVVFSKLEERAVRKALEAHTSSAKEPVREASSPMTRLFVMFLITAGIWFFLESDQKHRAAVAGSAAQAQAADQAPAEQWRFEGKVLDLLRDKPVAGAQLIFSSPGTSAIFSAATDPSGHYELALEPLKKGGYEVEINHQDYGGRWWDDEYTSLTKTQRYQLAGQADSRTPGQRARHVGKTDVPATYDFAVFPSDLTEAEKKEQSEALSGGQARD